MRGSNMQYNEEAVLDSETEDKRSETNLNMLFSQDVSFDALSHFIIARDLNMSAGIISEIDSIEMEEGFIY